jgi:hypothetical protein
MRQSLSLTLGFFRAFILCGLFRWDGLMRKRRW